MQHSQTHLRSRPIAAGQLRAFEAVARHLNFRLASEELGYRLAHVSHYQGLWPPVRIHDSLNESISIYERRP